MQINQIKVIVSCSGKFHAFALAEQLEKHSMLECFYTSFSSIRNPIAKHLIKRRDREKISRSKIRTNLLIAVGLKTFKKSFLWNELFDRWVAWKIIKSDANVFIGWSGMSKHSIIAAKKKGMITILERGSAHIIEQNKLLREEYSKYGVDFNIDKRVIKKEVEEYKLCDFISIPSNFALESFLKYKIEKKKLIVNNYGVSFNFKHSKNIKNKISDEFVVLFLGKLSIQKGVIYIVEAINELRENGMSVRGMFIGAMEDKVKELFSEINTTGIDFLGHVNHYELHKYLPNADVAVIPSIQDGFAMVVPQILACNVPVIVSENTGAYDIIEECKNGFIVPIRDSKSIVEKISYIYQNPGKLKEMKDYIAQNPIDLSWGAYGERYVKNLVQALNKGNE